MSTLAEFLLARIVDYEAAARDQVEIDAEFPAPDGYVMGYGWHRTITKVSSGRVHSSTFAPGAPSPGRVLAECAAKRAIVDVLQAFESALGEQSGERMIGTLNGLRIAAKELATVYADHPDYDEAWRP